MLSGLLHVTRQQHTGTEGPSISSCYLKICIIGFQTKHAALQEVANKHDFLSCIWLCIKLAWQLSPDLNVGAGGLRCSGEVAVQGLLYSTLFGGPGLRMCNGFWAMQKTDCLGAGAHVSANFVRHALCFRSSVALSFLFPKSPSVWFTGWTAFSHLKGLRGCSISFHPAILPVV